jgi:capsular exopolysaccharide synthesis family protein
LQHDKGLVDVLLGQATVQDAVRYQEANQIWTLSSGSPTQNPADLLGSERLKVLFDSFRKSFDFVIVDTPPVGPVIDPVVVSNIVDKILFVVKWGATAREMVQHAIDQLPNSKKIAGVVFNNVDDRQAKKYGKYSYANYYGSRYYSKYYSG